MLDEYIKIANKYDFSQKKTKTSFTLSMDNYADFKLFCNAKGVSPSVIVSMILAEFNKVMGVINETNT